MRRRGRKEGEWEERRGSKGEEGSGRRERG